VAPDSNGDRWFATMNSSRILMDAFRPNGHRTQFTAILTLALHGLPENGVL
jgi:hypothetical protein